MWKLNNTLLNIQQVKEQITGEIRKYLEMNENKNITYQNLQDTVKTMPMWKFSAYKWLLKGRKISSQ